MKKLMMIALTMLAFNGYAQKRATGKPDVDSLINNPDSIAVQQKLKQLGTGSEKNMLTVLNYYYDVKSKKDSVLHLIVKRYPKGDVAYNEAQQKIYAEDVPEQREALLVQLKKDFPDHDMDQANYVVSDVYAKNKNLPKMREYLDLIKDKSKKIWATGYNAQRLELYDPAAAENLLRPEVENMLSQGVPEEKSNKSRYYSFMYLFGDILIKEHKYQEALKYLSDAYPNLSFKSDNLLTDYGLALNKTGHHQDAVPALQKVIDNGKASPEVRAAFTESYDRANPGKNGAEYIRQADSARLAKMEAAVAKTEISQPSPAFEIKDVRGKTVSLKDFKGKTIILDFWATWCGPCKASFPAMQRVVNKYKDDHNVKFLFIHTLETKPNPLADATKYLTDNHYTFDLYIDAKDPASKKNDAFAAFGAQGIPAKFIIDSSGFIRFKLVGMNESDDDAVQNLSSMIEITKKAS